MKKKYSNLLNFAEPENNLSIELFCSEGFFWLITGTSSGFALEELEGLMEEEAMNSEIRIKQSIENFKQAIIDGEVSEAVKEEAKVSAIENLRMLKDYVNNNCSVFNYFKCMKLSKAIATYWLIQKLIEIEFQEVLSKKEIAGIYSFLDTVINDHEEIEIIEKKINEGRELSLDEKLYLRSGWQRGRFFWSKIYQDLLLLSEGLIPFNLIKR